MINELSGILEDVNKFHGILNVFNGFKSYLDLIFTKVHNTIFPLFFKIYTTMDTIFNFSKVVRGLWFYILFLYVPKIKEIKPACGIEKCIRYREHIFLFLIRGPLILHPVFRGQ